MSARHLAADKSIEGRANHDSAPDAGEAHNQVGDDFLHGRSSRRSFRVSFVEATMVPQLGFRSSQAALNQHIKEPAE
jgi:hypothetical protein